MLEQQPQKIKPIAVIPVTFGMSKDKPIQIFPPSSAKYFFVSAVVQEIPEAANH
jgi:hypothetical protein